jgi:hypothetical protein
MTGTATPATTPGSGPEAAPAPPAAAFDPGGAPTRDGVGVADRRATGASDGDAVGLSDRDGDGDAVGLRDCDPLVLGVRLTDGRAVAVAVAVSISQMPSVHGTPSTQSPLTLQTAYAGQRLHVVGPPQSTSVSPWLRIRSLHLRVFGADGGGQGYGARQ